jgi:threonine dehydratase
VIGLDDVRAAGRRLEGVVHRTPVLTSRTLDGATRASVRLKAENLQLGGSFKFRGAYNRISSLAGGELGRGVATFSSGNHAQAVALAARSLGSSAVVVMPRDAPEAKVAATRSYGGVVVFYDRYTQDREQLGRELADRRGVTLVPPYDDDLVMAGQGTAALELFDEVGELELVVVPVSGGGLIAGCATVAKGLHSSIRVVGVEPEGGDDTLRSLQAGRRVTLPEVPRTIADGLQVTSPGRLTFEVNRRLVDEVVTVSDPEIVAAMSFLFERLKVVVEPSGAVGVAALLSGRLDAAGARVGVILSGGNIDASRFARLLSRPEGSAGE